MGIKGIYAELGPGKRVSLAKLAADKLEETGRALRLAVDISIWQYQVQAAKGGTNPAERTLFYRLARLLSHAIEPIFVFDGPQKPVFKRNKRSTRVDTATDASAKKLLGLFGCHVHDAPGEAEAECALLQRHGIVDAVLSEDVDTIMFGCTTTLRNWTAETKSGSTPTHVSTYDAKDQGIRKSGLDREGMVLVALMSGGDYIPEGIPGCGPKVACEAARAGFGKSLCKIKRADEAGLRQWKESLVHELRTNESRFFKRRHMALAIPEDFPNLDVLRYYTHPVVSEISRVERLKADGILSRPIDMVPMRRFVEETFDWKYRIGADKLVRVLSPTLLVQKLLGLHSSQGSRFSSKHDREQEESALVRKIASRRAHHSTDGIEELRVHYVPADIAGLDLSAEIEGSLSFGRDGLALNSDDDFEEDALEPEKPAKKRFDPTQTDAVWIPECIVKAGAPLKVEEWEESKRKRLLARESKQTSTRRRGKGRAAEALPTATLDRWVNQEGVKLRGPTSPEISESERSASPKKAPALSQGTSGRNTTKERKAADKTKARKSKQSNIPAVLPPPDHSRNLNPWTIAGSQKPPRATKRNAASATGDHGRRGRGLVEDPIFLFSSSPPALRPTTPTISAAPATPATPDPLLPSQSSGVVSADVAATPGLGLSADPLDSPSWLRSSPRSTPKTNKKKQATLDSFFLGPDSESERPPFSKAAASRSPTRSKAAPPTYEGTLFPITKKLATMGTLPPQKMAPKPRSMPAYVLDTNLDPFGDFSDDGDDGGGVGVGVGVGVGSKAAKPEAMPRPKHDKHGTSASIIDLTQDDD